MGLEDVVRGPHRVAFSKINSCEKLLFRRHKHHFEEQVYKT
jgi:hypothetical protein